MKMNVTNKSNSTNVQHSSSSCKGASGVLQITGSNAVIFAVLEAWLMSPLHCLKLKVFFTLVSYNIQFMYDYDTIEKQERNILYAFNAVTSSCRLASFLQLFRKFVESPQSPTFMQKFLNKFLCCINFKTYKISIKIFH